MTELIRLAYLESEGDYQAATPFSHYAPPYANGICKKWLQTQHFSPNDWVLEPIGASTAAILEMAETGCRVLAAINNPVSAFEVSIMAQAPTQTELLSILNELSIQRKGDERLATHIQNLYATHCAVCGRETQAEYFKWHRSDDFPYVKAYHCPVCGDQGERPISEFDLDKLTLIKRSDPLHRARAIERVPEGTHEARQNLKEILGIYAPRSLFVLTTLINKLEGMHLSPQRRRLADALVLSVLDAGHRLWSADEGEETPRGLNIPTDWIERNLWQVLEKAAPIWSQRAQTVPLTVWPERPQAGGICLFHGRIRDLHQQKPDLDIKTIACVLPRPNQTFWTLSTLWSAWLWGKENAANLKNVLERQRFDWYWHANALHSGLAPAVRMAKNARRIFALLPQPTPGFVSAAVEACCASGLQLWGISYKDEKSTIQTEWGILRGGAETKKANLSKIIREAIHDCLFETGEPCHYQKLYTSVLCTLAQKHALPSALQQLTYDSLAEIHNEIAKVFSDRKFLRRLDASAQDLDSGVWWLTQSESNQSTLADRVETEVLQTLQKNQTLSQEQLRESINMRFSGFLTPSDDLLTQCLRSYATFDPKNETWSIKKNENLTQRENDLSVIQKTLAEIATKIGFHSAGENPVVWSTIQNPDQAIYRIFFTTSALISRILVEEGSGEYETIFLFPGSRSGLLRYKMDRDPWLRERIPAHWHFVKFRTLRELANRKELTKDLWDLFIDSDPISLEDATQLSMFL